MGEYAGFQMLQRFEEYWNELHKAGAGNAEAVKAMVAVASHVEKKCQRMNKMYVRLDEQMQVFPSVIETVDKITSMLGKLQDQFSDLEEVLSTLESVCEEENQIENVLRRKEELHTLKMTRLKELEDVKATLAKEHSALLQNVEETRRDRKLSAERALQKALWEIEPSHKEKTEQEMSEVSSPAARTHIPQEE